MPIEQPPQGTPEALAAYLIRMSNLTESLYSNIGKLPIKKLKPTKPQIGKLYYFGAAIPSDPDIVAEGLYLYKSSGWEQLTTGNTWDSI